MNETGKTIIEDDDSTLLEENNAVSEKFIRLNQEIKTFKDYSVIKQFSTFGSEADIYLVEREKTSFILKLYRYGISPKEEIINIIKKLGEEFPQYFVKIFEAGFANENNRWFEIQEFIEFSSLKEHKLNQEQLKIIIEKISAGLKILHDNNILHLDLKPANILIRSIEPLEPVFTDFGISSLLDPELTRKMTNIKGTPLYWSPESFTGVVGKEADYWSLGIIILEILSGRHPFSKMEQQVIMFTLSTRGINIPENIPDEFKLILHGLLTRDPRKRWGYEQVNKWLKGEKNIKVFYFEEKDERAEYQVPYEFQGEDFYSLKNLLNKFIASEESWAEARTHFEKGYISRWLEKNEDFSKAVAADKFKELENPDFGMLNLIYKFNPLLPFVLYGKYITLQNLYFYSAKAFKRESNDLENKILNDLNASVLQKFYQEYLELTGKEEDELSVFLDLTNKNKINHDLKSIYKCLNIIFEPEKFSLYHYTDLNTLVSFVVSYFGVIFPKQELLELIATYVFPQEFINALETDNPVKYGDTLKNIRYLKDNNYLIEKRELSKLYSNNMLPSELKIGLVNGSVAQYIMASGNINRLISGRLLINKEELDFLVENYVLPEYVKENLKSNSYGVFIDVISSIKELQDNNLLIEKKELLNLETFILPLELKENIKKGTLHLYQDTARNIRNLQEKNLLISKGELDRLNRQFILPAHLKESLKNNDYQEYFETAKNLRYLIENNLLLDKKQINRLPVEQSRRVISGSLSEYINNARSFKYRQEELKYKKRKQLETIALAGITIASIIFVIIYLFFR